MVSASRGNGERPPAVTPARRRGKVNAKNAGGNRMTPTTYHGVVRGGVVQLDAGVSLADGTEVNVIPAEKPVPNGPALVAALAAGPHVPKEWVDELERLIREGERPPMLEDIFPEEPDAEEGR